MYHYFLSDYGQNYFPSIMLVPYTPLDHDPGPFSVPISFSMLSSFDPPLSFPIHGLTTAPAKDQEEAQF
jgi:hypothetical protein